MLMKMAARIRGLFAGNYAENDEQSQVLTNNRGDLLIAQGLPELTELVRLGGSWQVASAAGLAALTALPTTTAGLSLYNGEQAGANSICYAIDSFGSVEEVIDATQADTTAIFALNNAAPIATVPTDAALSIRSLSGRSGYGGKAKTVAGATVTNNGWFAHGPQALLAPAVAAANWKVNEVSVRGLYLVPPGGQFNIVAVKAAAAAALQQFYFVRWHEVRLNVVS